MRPQWFIFCLLAGSSFISLGGCEAPRGSHYPNAVYDAPAYDADIYMPKYTIEPAYDHSYYHFDDRDTRL